MIYPVPDERAIYIKEEEAIVIADLHIGIEFEYHLQGLNIPLQTSSLIKRTETLIEKNEANRLIIVGDLKHVIGFGKFEERKYFMEKERKEVGFFLKKISEIAEILIAKGNHDWFLRSKRAKIYPSQGFKIDDISFVHGHAWPSSDVMDSKNIVFAHIHPMIEIRSSYGYYAKPCWLRGNILKKYGRNKRMGFILMPPFNPLCGGVAINREKLGGVIPKIIDLQNSYVYLLDGINLGRVKNLKKFLINVGEK